MIFKRNIEKINMKKRKRKGNKKKIYKKNMKSIATKQKRNH
jgi:hypothetical protein